MMRRQQLTETQIAALFEPSMEQRDLVRHYTLTETDLAMIRRCRGDHSRLGYALMLCYLRHPGRPLRTNERPSAALVSFVAEQIDVRPEAIGDYLASEQNRRRHAAELQDRLRLRPFGKRAAAELANDLHSQALENDRLFHLAELVMEECRKRRVVVPAPRRLERLCIDLRFRARREIEHRLTLGLSHEQRRQLDALTQRRAETGQSRLVWLRQMPLATKPAAMLGLIERLNRVRAIGIDAARGHRVHQARLAQLAREAGRTTAQHLSGYERLRRHAILVAITQELGATLTDQAIDLFERLVGTMFSKAETRHARAFQADGSAINEKVRLYARVGAAVIAAREAGQDPFDAISTVIPWERFRASVAEAEALARPEEFDSYEMLGEHYAAVRRWAPAFLATFSFQGVPAAASLLGAVEVLRRMNEAAAPKLPKSAPTGFIRERWSRYVMPGGALDRRYYELCVLSELCGRLRAGDVWVVGSRRYRSFEERLISREVLEELLQSGSLPVAVDPDFEHFIAGRRALLDARLAAVDAKAKGGLLPDVSLGKGMLKITPIVKSTPPDAEVLAARLYAMLTRMAEACTIASLGQLAWLADWHIRDETYALALRRLIDQQQREPRAVTFGGGFASSSDGQFFRAGGFGRDPGRVNAHYG